ncbi:hypothetical protein M0E87_11360 [Corynebacterium sp. CCM 9185]|uniref:Uncharacterized protein n=1 Tax=Corynebacterium marambiense TaxID=2765364 RepID=A0ABS0VUQ3_9CORY|nr:hypothetical protein [Corynebacterium marambiense]MBI9000493.1 hypothetical protein [Corynebacterium marambiense]MCK7664246.1 hypothetical protein [Corynebacterium marambiense]MCX7543446.1 hypothetical protein [Corynebacterium marambiense]
MYVSDVHAEIHYPADEVGEPLMSGGFRDVFQAAVAWFQSLFTASS